MKKLLLYSALSNTRTTIFNAAFLSFRCQHSETIEGHAIVPRPYSEMPQPKRLPFLGTMLDFTTLRNYEPSQFYEFLKKRHNGLGPIYKEPKIPGLKGEYVATCNPDDIEILFRNEGKWPMRPRMESMTVAREKLGQSDGLGNLQGERWYKLRKLINEHLLTNKAIWSCANAHLNVSKEFTAFAEKNLDENNEVELDNALSRWALENAIVFTLDSRLDAFSSVLSDDVEAIITTTLRMFKLWTKMGFSLPFWKIFNTSDLKEIVELQRNQTDSLKRFIQSRPNMGRSVLEKATAASDISQEDIEMILPDLLAAGVDSTSNAAAFVLYCVATNPEKQELLREEIFKMMNSSEEFTGKTLQQMKYLHAVILETQRCFPLAHGTARILDRDLVLSGYEIPAGTTILLTANLVNNLDEKYFEDPHTFLPERWISLKSYKHNRFALSGSFGMGARMCPGRRFALQEVGCLLIAVLSRFKVEYHHKPFKNTFRMVSAPSEKARFRFVPL